MEGNKIYNALFSSQKVELSISDLNKSSSKISNFIKEYKATLTKLKEYSKVLSTSESKNKEGYDLASEADKVREDLVKAYNTLGLPISDLIKNNDVKKHQLLLEELKELNKEVYKQLKF